MDQVVAAKPAPRGHGETLDLDAVGRPGPEFPWQLVLENTIVGISYMRDRCFLWANARMAEIFGYRPGELDGQPVRRLYACREDYEDVGRLMSATTDAGFVTHERGMACKDGSLIWCRISGRILRRDRAGFTSVWVVQDLSDKKRAEDELRRVNQRLEQIVERRTMNLRRTNEALRAEIERGRLLRAAAVASRQKYRTLFRHMPLGVIVLDTDRNISEVNRTLQAYLGATTRAHLEQLVGDPVRVRLPDGRATSLADLLRGHATAQGPRVDRFEFGWLAPSGRRRAISAIGALLATSSGGVVFTLADVTEQHHRREREHAQQAALAHASRLSLMGQMASALAHELGQPLNASQSYLNGLKHRLADVLARRPEVAQALDKVTSHLEQACQIIRNVRGFVSRERPEFAPVDLQDLVAQTLQLLELPIATSRVQVHVKGREPGARALVPARCHPVEIQQVLVNLIINAIEAMAETPVAERAITIRVQQDARGMLVVEVADRGPGVDAELAQRIFEPYVTSKADGLGMGLMISCTIVESHGGALRLVKGKGGGAVFRFTLPPWKQP